VGVLAENLLRLGDGPELGIVADGGVLVLSHELFEVKIQVRQDLGVVPK
jgi:hypothetical protein